MRLLIFLFHIFLIEIVFTLPTTNNVCNKNTEFDCQGGKLKCIPLEWQCDNVADCDNRLDEQHCTYPIKCDAGHMMCKSGECVSREFKCDGEEDCRDGTDEHHCDYKAKIVEIAMMTSPAAAVNVNAPECLAPRMRCSSGQCIAADLICDGHKDCSNGDDERNCSKPVQHHPPSSTTTTTTADKDDFNVEECRPGYIMCHSGDVCIPKQFVCDGTPDCVDESDELDCQVDIDDETSFIAESDSIKARCVAEGKFHCRADVGKLPICLNMTSTCNGIRECPHGDDESMKCSECSRKQCDHTCLNTPHGAKCICQEGYKLADDGMTCEDEDDCVANGHKCHHFCQDRVGSYSCSCQSGYTLQDDDHSCRLEDDDKNTGLLFISLGSEIRNMPLVESHEATYSRVNRIGGHGISRSIDFMHRNNKLYLTIAHQQGDVIEGELAVSDNGLIRILRENVAGLGSIAVDWIGGNIFFTQRAPAKHIGISVCTTNGLFCRWIIKGEVSNTREMSAILQQNYRGLAINPVRGYMVWIESFDGLHRIMKANLDGNDIRTLIDTKLGSPSALTLDYVKDDVYFGDFDRRLIERVNVDTAERRIVISSGVHHPFDMAYFNGFLYWSDWGSENLKYQEMHTHHTHSQPQLIHTFNRFPYGLAINHSMYQLLPAKNPCLELECPWICVLVPKAEGISTAKCICPDRYTEDQNNTCTPPKDTPHDYDDQLSYISPALMEEYCDSGVGCQNGGSCRKMTNEHGREHRIVCDCLFPYDGEYCERLNQEMLKQMEEDSTFSLLSVVIIVVLIVALTCSILYCVIEKREMTKEMMTNARIRVDNLTRQAENSTQPVIEKLRTVFGKNGHSTPPREGIRSANNVNFVTEETMEERRERMLESPTSYQNPLYDEPPPPPAANGQPTYTVIGSSSPIAGVLRFHNDSLL